MSLAAKIDSRPDSGHPRLGTRRLVQIARDFAVLVGASLTVGLTIGLGMMLAVLILA